VEKERLEDQDAEPGGGAPRVQARPVSIRVGGEGVDDANAEVKANIEGALHVPQNLLEVLRTRIMHE
jgi:hypothetical protein